MANIEKMIASTFMEIAQGLETGSFGKRPKIALTGMGSEHGEENSMAAAIEAAKDGIDVYYFFPHITNIFILLSAQQKHLFSYNIHH